MSTKPSNKTYGLRSEVWNHFKKMGKNALCRCCNRRLYCSSSTSNLRRHLANRHGLYLDAPKINGTGSKEDENISPVIEVKSELMEISVTPYSPSSSIDDSPEQPSEPFASSPCLPTSSSSTPLKPATIGKIMGKKPNDFDLIDLQLLKMLCKEHLSFSLVESVEFKTFVNMLNSDYKIPTEKKLCNSHLPFVFNDLITKIKCELMDASAVCLTLNRWTSINNISYYALTVHFINTNSQFKGYVLECVILENDTGEDIKTWIKLVLLKFDISDKVIAIVSNKDESVKTAASLLNIRYLPCFAHSLSLIVQNAIKISIQTTVEKVKEAVMFFKNSPSSLKKLTQGNLTSEELKSQEDVSSNWKSMFEVFKHFLSNKRAIISTIELDDNLNGADWKIIQQAVDILQIFDEVTSEISSEKYIFLSKTVVIVRLMEKIVNEFVEKSGNESEQTKSLGSELLKGLWKQFGNIFSNDLVTQATLLDPRFKKQSFLDDGEFKECYSGVLAELKAMFPEQKIKKETDQPSPSSSKSIWAEFDKAVEMDKSAESPSAADVELDRYIAEPYLPRNNDPMVWWESKKQKYPMLYELALKRLCIPATSVSCEQIVSRAWQMGPEKRNKLSSEQLSQLLFLNQNLE